MPPPNVIGSLHMVHAMFVTLEDIMVRYSRMRGRPTLWIPGTDHASITTQLVVEKMLASEGVKWTDLSRDEFNKRVWEWKQKEKLMRALRGMVPAETFDQVIRQAERLPSREIAEK